MKAALFNRYLNPVFVETGTKDGDGIKAAIMAGYQVVISIEKEKDRYMKARAMFEGNDKVRLFLGDSAEILFDVIAPMLTRITFWLDANYNTDEPMGAKCPILEELKQIAKHPIKTHTLLIDDTRYYGDAYKNVELNDVKQAILNINKRYNIKRDTVRSKYPKDVLIAEAPIET